MKAERDPRALRLEVPLGVGQLAVLHLAPLDIERRASGPVLLLRRAAAHGKTKE